MKSELQFESLREDVEEITFGEGGNALKLSEAELRRARHVQQPNHLTDEMHIDRSHVRIRQGIRKRLEGGFKFDLLSLLP